MIYQTLKLFSCIRWCTKYCYKRSNNNNIIKSILPLASCFFQLYVVGAACQILIQHLFMILCNLKLTFAHIYEDLNEYSVSHRCWELGGILQNLMQVEAWVNTWGSIVELKMPFLQSKKKKKNQFNRWYCSKNEPNKVYLYIYCVHQF